MDLINPFTNIRPQVQTSIQEYVRYGRGYLNNVNEIRMGTGTKAFKGDKQGIWLGANKFENAPFSVDMGGNIVASSLLTKSGVSQQLDGSIEVGQTGNIVIDGVNKRIIMYDENGDARFLLGKGSF